ncbi:hypothetical protein POL88_15600 [Priestia megaterium]|uniref:hypothetical protein n=1 Tax=Priestia megaterium TaxID=1404 RepID=UPI00234F98E8|nr:hypothetical protein [Priestia megaterium]MDC7770352.1 hypothetical protein [Priestia megaterium]
MTVENGLIDVNELERIEVLGIPFGYKITKNEDGNTNIVILPSPDEAEDFNAGTKHASYETLMLIRSKYFFGINNRTQMFGVLYNTFVEHYKKEQKNVNDLLTLQALYSDMIIRLGMILEDFAGICYACKEYQQHHSDIAQVFLAYSDPMSFYNSIKEKKGKRTIKQIFGFPQSKGELNKIFKDLSEEEMDLLMRAIESSATLIHDRFCYISNLIVRKEKENVTYYDMYNKHKHGFSPYYPYIAPMPLKKTIEGTLNEDSIEKLIYQDFFENLTIMHDKLPGQRTPEEQKLYKDERLATPTFVDEEINLNKVEEMNSIVAIIHFIYRYLMQTYLRRFEENIYMSFLMSDDYLSVEERRILDLLINDESRYNV